MCVIDKSKWIKRAAINYGTLPPEMYRSRLRIINRSARIVRVPRLFQRSVARAVSRIFARALRKYAKGSEGGDGAISEVKHDVMWAQINAATDKINIYIRARPRCYDVAYHIFFFYSHRLYDNSSQNRVLPRGRFGKLDEKSFLLFPSSRTSENIVIDTECRVTVVSK